MGLVLKANTMASAIADSLTAQPPRILAANLLRATEATPTASAETAVTGVKENAYAEGLTSDFWRPGSSGTHWLRASFTSVYSGVSVYTGDLDTSSLAVTFSFDGKRIYTGGFTGFIHSFSLRVPFDMSTAVYDEGSATSIAAQTSGINAMSISPDGRHFYVLGSLRVWAYTLGTAYDITTAVYDTGSELDTSGEAPNSFGMATSSDGLHVFVSDINNDKIYRYTLSTAFDLTTASYDGAGAVLDVAAIDTVPTGIAFTRNGTTMYLVGHTNDDIKTFTLGTPWDLTTANYQSGQDLSVAAQDGQPYDIACNPDGTTVIVTGDVTDTLYEYRMGVPANALGIAAHDLHNHGGTVKAQYGRELSLDVSAQDTNLFGLVISSDGLHLYIVGRDGDKVYAYTLSVAYDISTAVYDGTSSDLDVSGQDLGSQGITISSNGLHLYMVGSTAAASVYAYTMSVAHDLSTATYDGAPDDLDVSGQDTAPQGCAISSDGLHLAVVGSTGGNVYFYTFGVAYDGSSLTYDGAPDDLNVSPQDTTPRGVTISSDGLHLYVVGIVNDKVYAYTFGTAYDGSTLTYDGAGDDLDISGEDIDAADVSISSDGFYLFIIGRTSDRVFTYSLSTAYDLSTAEYLTWLDSSETFTPRTSEPILILFDDKIALNHRLLITVTSAPNIGSVYLGCAIPFDGVTQRNFTPPSLSTRDKHLPSISEGGHFLGRSIVNQGTSMTLTMSGVGLPWLRAQWEAQVRLLEQYPFFFALRDVPKLDGIAEGETFYGWVTAQPSAGYKSGVYGTIALSARGIVT